MQLPSLYYLVAEAGRAARRFPLTLLCTFALCVAGCPAMPLTTHGAQQADWVFPLGSAAALGLPLTLALLGAFAVAKCRQLAQWCAFTDRYHLLPAVGQRGPWALAPVLAVAESGGIQLPSAV